MHKEYHLYSTLADHISAFIDEKKAMGYTYITQESIMKRFDSYWLSHGYPCEGLSVDNLSDWLTMKETEHAGGFNGRISVLREFSKYLNGIGVSSYIPKAEVRYESPLPHIFTESEIQALFYEIDTDTSSNQTHYSRRIANECPVLFRLIYLHGLRISEACGIAVSMTDFDNGLLTIVDGKRNKDRLIYLAPDICGLCKDYLHFLEKTLGQVPEWLFPGMNPNKPITITSAAQRFHGAWKKTKYATTCSITPTVHDLRHTYVVKRINEWMKQGLDFTQMLPYLSKFLGHKSFLETFYYYHYVEEAAETIHAIDKTAELVIPEVMRR